MLKGILGIRISLLARDLLYHVLRRVIDTDVDAADVFADEAKHHQDAAADNQDERDDGAPAVHRGDAEQPAHNHENREPKAQEREEEPEERAHAQRLDRERGEAVKPQAQQAHKRIARSALQAGAVVRLDPGNLAGGAEHEPHQVREGIPVVAHLADYEPARHVEAHEARHPRTEASEQVLLDLVVVGVHDVVAFLELRDKVVQGIQRGLAVVIQRHDVLAGTLAVARHQRGMLSEVLGQVDADDVFLRIREPLDDAPHVVGAAIVH